MQKKKKTVNFLKNFFDPKKQKRVFHFVGLRAGIRAHIFLFNPRFLKTRSGKIRKIRG